MKPEEKIESAVTRYAEDLGMLHLKINVLGRRGWPDHFYFGPHRRLVMIEFKAPGKVPRKLQKWVHGKLAGLGWPVHIIDNVEDGKRALMDP